MIFKKLFGIKLAAIALVLFFGTLALNDVAEAAYPAGPTFNYGCMYESPITVANSVGTILVNSPVSNCTQRSNPAPATACTLAVNSTYTVRLYGAIGWGNCCYPMNYRAWMDWNGNETFNDAGELIWTYSYGYSWKQWNFTVPQIAEGKTFRLRIAQGYYYYTIPNYTGSTNNYGDFGDLLFTVPKPPADAGATAITQPAGAFTQGTQNIAVRIKNFAQKALTSCRIVWRIDEGLGTESSNTYSWTGSLAQNVEEVVVVGTYNFSQMRQYTLDAFTEYPNADIDVDNSNDRAMTRYVAPAMSPTNYYIGAYAGSSNTFATITDATNYLSQAGVLGDGVLTFVFPSDGEAPPEEYDGPIVIGSYPSVGNNTVAFKSETDNAEDVIINFNPDGTTPFLMSLTNVNNTSIQGLTFNTSASGSGYGGIISLQDCQNISVSNNIFNNVVGAAPDFNSTSINVITSYDIHIYNNTFNDGAIGINEQSFCPRKLNIHNNDMQDATYMFISLYGTPDGNPCAENDVKIHNNTFLGTDAQNGIRATNSTEITDNFFAGFTGTSPDDAVIYVTNTDPANFTNGTDISNNSLLGDMLDINGIFAENEPILNIQDNQIKVTERMMPAIVTSGIKLSGCGNSTTPVYIINDSVTAVTSANNNGISATNSNIRINLCDVDMGSAGATVYSIYTSNSSGYMSNSQIGATDATCVYLDNSNMGVYYNSIANESANLPTFNINGGTNTIRRNIIQNQQSNLAIVVGNPGGNTLDENNYYSTGTVLGRWSGIACADLAAWQATSGQDVNSTNIVIDFIDFAQFNLGLNTFDEALVFDAPIDFGDPVLDALIQQRDYNGNIRYSYFMGSENIIPEVFITTQPTGVMDCLGATGHFLGVSGYVTRGVQSKYEWFKDGVSLTSYYLNPGTDDWAQKASLYLNNLPFGGGAGLTYEMEGEYQCIVRGSGAEPKYTDHVLVNVLHPAEITREPEDVRANLGDDVILEVEAHIVADEGVDDPFFQPEVQWYRGTPPVAIENDLSVDGHYSGAKSTILSVRNLSAAEIGDDYFVELIGACETLTSKSAGIAEFPGVNISEQPAPADVCEGTQATFSIDASSPDPEATLEYQWRFNGYNIPGATTNTYVIPAAGAGDVGVYDCVITVLPGGKTETSDPANLDIKLPPAITTQPEATKTVAPGASFTLTVVATGEPTLAYQWYLNAAMINGATNASYTVASATLTDAGSYTCIVTNVCGTVTSDASVVSVNPGGMTDVSDLANGGFQLTGNTPNPFAETSKLSFFAPRTTFVRLAITDVFGQEVALLVNNTVSAGPHDVDVNASQLMLSSGVYYYTMTSNNYSITRKMIVVR